MYLHEWMNEVITRFASDPAQPQEALAAPMLGKRVPHHRWLFGARRDGSDQITPRLSSPGLRTPSGAKSVVEGAVWTTAQQRLLHELCALACGDESLCGQRIVSLPNRGGSRRRADAELARELHALFTSHTAEQVLAEVVRYFDERGCGTRQ